MIERILRKLHLGRLAYKLGKAFVSDKGGLPDAETAMEQLKAVSPDCGNSALCGRTAGEKQGVVDIVIPVYNAEKYLRRCIDSVLNQKTTEPYRLIIVNDGSTDASAEILKEYAGDERLLVVTQPNGGHSAARNTGLRHVRAEYVLFADADDVICDGAIEKLIRCARQTGADIVEGSYRVIEEDDSTVSTVAHREGNMKLPGDSFGFVWNMLMKTELWDGIQFPLDYWYEDSIMYQLVLPGAAKQNKLAVGLDETTYLYRFNRQGFTQSNKSKPKSLDSLWITLTLFRDRQKLGLENTQDYYEYILNMLPQTYRRTSAMSDEVQRALFAVWRDFIMQNFEGFSSRRDFRHELESAVYSGDYGRYRLYCSLM